MATKGYLSDMNLPTLVQVTCQSGGPARLSLRRGDQEAVLYFDQGNIVHAVSADQEGKEVVYRVLTWEDGEFSLESGVSPPARTIETPWSALLIEGLQRHDEERWDITEIEHRRDTMPAKTTTDILKSFLDVPGISTAVVVGRDGFVIEAVGGTRALNLDALGASLAYAINGIERMGQELQIKAFQDLFVEYGGALIIARPVGEAILALVAADASQLGVVRYQIKSLVKELASYF